MTITLNWQVLGCIMVLVAIVVASKLASLESRTVDIIVGVLIFLLIVWILLTRAAPLFRL